MERISKQLFDRSKRKFFPCRLYRPDIEEMIALAKEAGMQVEIADDKYRYDSIEELKEQRGDKILKLHLAFHRAGLAFEIVETDVNGAEVTLSTTQHSDCVALWHKFQRLVELRMPALARLARPEWWLAAGIAVSWTALMLRTGDSTRAGLVILIALGMFGIGLFAQLYAWNRRGIVLKKEHEVQSFWQKHGKDVILLVLGAILAAILRAVFNLLVR